MKFRKTFITLAASAMSLSMMTAPFLSNGNIIPAFTAVEASAASLGVVTQDGITYRLFDSVKYNNTVKYNAAYIEGCSVESGCVTIPEGIYVDGNYYKIYKIYSLAFENSKISAIDMHNAYSLFEIHKDAFRSCNNLTDVLLPPNLKADSDLHNMFFSCRSLRSFGTVPCANYSIIDGAIYNKEATELLLYPRGKDDSDYSFPATVESFNKGAFYGSYNNIKNMNLASDVTEENARKQIYIYFDIANNGNDITLNGSPVYIKDETNESEPVINPVLKEVFYDVFPEFTNISDAYARDYAEYVVKNVIDDGDSDFDKAVKLHDWLCDHAKYDPEVSYIISEKLPYTGDEKNHCYASAFLHYEKVHGRYDHEGLYTVCDGYAMAYKLLMNAAGVSCERVSGGPAEGEKYAHAWNIIRFNDKDDDSSNDKYYYIDVTSDSAGNYDNFMNFAQGADEGYSKKYVDWVLDSNDAFDTLPEKVVKLVKYGDADNNGYLTIDDYIKIKEIIADGSYVEEADVNCDGQVNNDDADIMAKYILIKRGNVKVNEIIDEDDVKFLKATISINSKANLGFDVNLDGKVDFADVEMLEMMKGAKCQLITNVESCLIKDLAYHTSPVYNIGDIDGSGNINNADIMILKGIISADAEDRDDIYTEEEHSRADINHDGKVTSADSDIMYDYLRSAVSGNDISFCQFVIESIMNQ